MSALAWLCGPLRSSESPDAYPENFKRWGVHEDHPESLGEVEQFLGGEGLQVVRYLDEVFVGRRDAAGPKKTRLLRFYFP